VRFLVDMPLSPALADWLTAQGHDAVHASRVGLALESDETILAHAANSIASSLLRISIFHV